MLLTPTATPINSSRTMTLAVRHPEFYFMDGTVVFKVSLPTETQGSCRHDLSFYYRL